MFDKAEEILVTLKERLTSPLFSSFLISWLVINWKVSVGLFWLNTQQLNVAGYKTYIDLVSANINIFHTLFYPLTFAIAYTFGYPYIKNEINVYLSKRNKEGDNRIFGVQKDGSMPISRYIKLKEGLDKRAEEINRIILEASKIEELNTGLQAKLDSAHETISDMTKEANQARRRYDYSMLNGLWKRDYDKPVMVVDVKGARTIDIHEVVSFNNSRYQLIDKGVPTIIGDIYNFQYDLHNSIFFIKQYSDIYAEEKGIAKTSICRLIISETLDEMTGVESGVNVTYKRINQQ
jgi:hypothetical protein